MCWSRKGCCSCQTQVDASLCGREFCKCVSRVSHGSLLILLPVPMILQDSSTRYPAVLEMYTPGPFMSSKGLHNGRAQQCLLTLLGAQRDMQPPSCVTWRVFFPPLFPSPPPLPTKGLGTGEAAISFFLLVRVPGVQAGPGLVQDCERRFGKRGGLLIPAQQCVTQVESIPTKQVNHMKTESSPVLTESRVQTGSWRPQVKPRALFAPGDSSTDSNDVDV